MAYGNMWERADKFSLSLVEDRPHPKALRPLYLVNDAGGTITWEAWLKRTKADPNVKITAMVFEDGFAADAEGVLYVGTGQTRGTMFRGRRYDG